MIAVQEPKTLEEMKAVYYAARERIKAAEMRAKRLADIEKAKIELTQADKDRIEREKEQIARDAYEKAWADRIEAERKKRLNKRGRDVIKVSTKTMPEAEWISIASRIDATRHAKKIIAFVAKRAGLSMHVLLGKSRMPAVIAPRHVAIQIVTGAKKCSGLSLAEIGKIFGGRDHTSILHAAQKRPCFRERRAARTLKERGLAGAHAARIPSGRGHVS